MNLAEHPQALDLSKRIRLVESEDKNTPKSIPVQIMMPGMGQLMGALREGGTPGLFILTSKVDIKGTGQTGVMDFAFTADKPTAIIHPDLTAQEPKSRIIQ
jgi:hypothetical protein